MVNTRLRVKELLRYELRGERWKSGIKIKRDIAGAAGVSEEFVLNALWELGGVTQRRSGEWRYKLERGARPRTRHPKFCG